MQNPAKKSPVFPWALLALSLLPLQAQADSTPTYFVLGRDIPPATQGRLKSLISLVAPQTQTLSADASLPSDGLVIALGDSAIAEQVISKSDLAAQGAEGFVVKAQTVGTLEVIAADGNAAADEVAGNSPHRGAAYGAYAALEELGFAFLHPLHATLPSSLKLARSNFTRAESPRWPERGLHLHTMHPIELSHLLNGWGPQGPCDASARLECDDSNWTPLEQSQWEPYLEWMTANRQNLVEWVLLQSKGAYENFANSPTLQRRLTKLVARAHAWDMRAGIDVPIALAQQNGWRLIRSSLGKNADPVAAASDYHRQIRANLDYIMAAHFDFIGTEMGFSEFTSPSGKLMLDWIDGAASYLRDHYHVRLSVKSHVSTGQFAKDVDPSSKKLLYPDWDHKDQPIDFNYLTDYAEQDVMVLPHTVEAYSLTDPAPTYGNTSFADMHRFIVRESQYRDSLWYPETAYWVSVDSDVPLFLPIYPERRIADLRQLAHEQDERIVGPHLKGQLIFSSGWEWGYWLNDLIAARAAWNPHLEASSDEAAFQASLQDALRSFGPAAAPLAAQISQLAAAQADELIFGRNAGSTGPAPTKIDPRATGFAYLSGVDTWDEISFIANDLTKKVSTTQPTRTHLRGYHVEKFPYQSLLDDMEQTHQSFATSVSKLAPSVPAQAAAEFSDLRDSLEVTALRATQVAELYAHAFPQSGLERLRLSGDRNALALAETSLDRAQAIVSEREHHYRVDPNLIAAWGPNPTVYPFGYIWSIHSLYYWRRDEGLVTKKPTTPCFMNVLNPANVALADGTQDSAYKIIQDFKPVLGELEECLSPKIKSQSDFDTSTKR